MSDRVYASFSLPIFMLEKLHKQAVTQDVSMAQIVREALRRPLKISKEQFDILMGSRKPCVSRRKKPKWDVTPNGRSAVMVFTMPEEMYYRLKLLARRRGASMSWIATTALMWPLGITQKELDEWNEYELPIMKYRKKGYHDRVLDQKVRLW
jgi:hypothetical protein